MELNTLWFFLIAVLYVGFFVLEGFDFGVGILLPFLGKNDTERRAVINTIGPHWDGNEVWLLTAGGATFAAFPHWYATLFSGFYLPLFFLLVALILRGVAFEFRSKDDNPLWRSTWDWTIFGSSLVAALLLGVAFSNLARGVPIDANMIYVGGFFNLLNPYALLGGVSSVLAFALHGAIFLTLKTSGSLTEKARQIALRLWLPTTLVLFVFAGATYISTDILTHIGINPGPIPVLSGVAILLSGWFLKKQREGWAFSMTSLGIASAVVSLFLIMFPRVMISSLNPEWSLTIQNASSSPYTLQVMTIVTIIFLPFVLLYQGWSYWVFRARVKNDPKTLTY
jgi:cytochrome bd ubiquinol oxidase subunit II